MADSRDDERLFVIDPEIRGVFDLNNFHIPKRLKRIVATTPYQISANHCFDLVIKECAKETANRKATWINDEIIRLYSALNAEGHAHSIEVWEDDDLIGGLYGVSLGGAFFGESMFSTRPNASKIALVHLVAALKYADFQLLDAQYHNNHLAQFGLKEIPRFEFHELLKDALRIERHFPTENFTPKTIASSLPVEAQAQQGAAQSVPAQGYQSAQAHLASAHQIGKDCLSSGRFCLQLLA